MSALRTNVYIDGFNFYYGCVKGTACKWLDFRALCLQLFDPTRNTIETIKYFTARVDGRGDPPPAHQARCLPQSHAGT